MKKIFTILILGILIINVSNTIALKREPAIDFQKNIETFSEDEYNMVIISTNYFASTIQKLIDHKNDNGLKTYFKNVKEIYKEYSGRDRPEKIKYFIKDAIETKNISYVLLVGHVFHTPMREMTYYEIDMDFGLGVFSDLYYADVYDENGSFCSWDSNNNNLFGEYLWLYEEPDVNIDNVDLSADVHIGRIPCFSTRDLTAVINKIINYENSAYGSDWFNRVLLLGGDTFYNDPYDYIEGEFITGCVGQYMEEHGFETTKLWASENNFKPFKINREINKGAGFISYSGHGLVNGIQTSPPNSTKPIIYFNFHLFGLRNQNKLPIVFFDACSTARLNYLISPFAYNMVKKSGGGAIAAIGATEYANCGISKEGNLSGCFYLNVLFFKNYEEGTTVGEMFTRAQNEYLDTLGKDCFTLGEFILIGDPSLKVGGYN